jgi:hypothetical protein
MARKRLAAAKVSSAALGPGLHGAVIELKSDRAFQVRTAAGARVMAVLDHAVDPALADDCLRTGRMVILVDSEQGPAIVGALQTSVPIARDADGVVAIAAKDLRIKLDRSALIEVGPVAITADSSGAVRLEGNQMVIDMAALVRVLSLKVELP